MIHCYKTREIVHLMRNNRVETWLDEVLDSSDLLAHLRMIRKI